MALDDDKTHALTLLAPAHHAAPHVHPMRRAKRALLAGAVRPGSDVAILEGILSKPGASPSRDFCFWARSGRGQVAPKLPQGVIGGLERRSDDYRTTPDIDRGRRGGRALTQ
jgi:hypothetical protein